MTDCAGEKSREDGERDTPTCQRVKAAAAKKDFGCPKIPAPGPKFSDGRGAKRRPHKGRHAHAAGGGHELESPGCHFSEGKDREAGGKPPHNKPRSIRRDGFGDGDENCKRNGAEDEVANRSK